jgi:hypothetical protein
MADWTLYLESILVGDVASTDDILSRVSFLLPASGLRTRAKGS